MSERADPIECPYCAEPTMPNRLADGALVCSCAAERPLPEPPPETDHPKHLSEWRPARLADRAGR